jgi:hypothetical protein
MVLVLGQAQLQTVLSSKKVDQLNADVANSMNLGEEWMDDFYDTFRLNVTDVQALITRVQNYHALFTMVRLLSVDGTSRKADDPHLSTAQRKATP